MRIAVTGATGNVASALIPHLLRAGEHQIVGLARRLPADPDVGGSVEWRSVDLTDDACLSTLREVFAEVDAVVHLAWGFQPSHDEKYLAELGIGGTRRVLEAVAAVGVPHLVHQSSLGAYAAKSDDTPVDESWPTLGIPTSQYSRHKAAAEGLLDEFEAAGHETVVTRMRPGIVGQRTAASGLLRYGVPALVPARAVTLLPVLPMDRRLVIPMVHADDVADAIERVLARRAPGAFNLAADPPITAAVLAEVLGARLVHVPSPLVRAAMSASWHLHLQQVDTGWLDMGFAVPLLDTTRARTVLDWTPTRDAVSVLREVVEGMRDAAYGPTPVLRERTVAGALRDAVRRGPVARRTRP